MRRCLWDVTCKDYKDRGRKAKAVAELALKYWVSMEEIEKNGMDCNNYREISLLSTSYKILSNILLSRMTPYSK